MGAYRDMGTRQDGAVLALLGCLGRAPSAEQTPKVFSYCLSRTPGPKKLPGNRMSPQGCSIPCCPLREHKGELVLWEHRARLPALPSHQCRDWEQHTGY